MEEIKFPCFIVGKRAHGEQGVLLSLLTESFGMRQAFLHHKVTQKSVRCSGGLDLGTYGFFQGGQPTSNGLLHGVFHMSSLEPHWILDDNTSGFPPITHPTQYLHVCAFAEKHVPAGSIYGSFYNAFGFLLAQARSVAWPFLYLWFWTQAFRILGYGVGAWINPASGNAQRLADNKTSCAVGHEKKMKRQAAWPSLLKMLHKICPRTCDAKILSEAFLLYCVENGQDFGQPHMWQALVQTKDYQQTFRVLDVLCRHFFEIGIADIA